MGPNKTTRKSENQQKQTEQLTNIIMPTRDAWASSASEVNKQCCSIKQLQQIDNNIHIKQ